MNNDLVIVKVKDGINVKPDMLGYWKKEIMKQKDNKRFTGKPGTFTNGTLWL